MPELYQWSLSIHPHKRSGEIEWQFDNAKRRNSGSYFTPNAYVDKLLSFAIDARSECQDRQFTCCDPACGAGAFLVAASRQIASQFKIPFKDVIASSIFGCDIDPVAITLCKLMIWLETGELIPENNLLCADALRLDWSAQFPNVFSGGGFDAIIGNPPFGAVVDGRVPEYVKELRSQRFAELGGTADLAFYFVSLANRLAKPKGKVAMVLPRSFLSARSAKGLRSGDRTFATIESCTKHDSFDGAAIYVCLAGFHSRVGSKSQQPMVDVVEPKTLSVTASLTVSEAYDLNSSIIDRKEDGGSKLLTTGLIDPERSLWGEVPCRYLKTKYQHPRIPQKDLRPSRQLVAGKPKIIVAGLSQTIECFLDKYAEYVGSVSTYTITHPADDIRALEQAVSRLHSEEIAARFRQELGPSALGGGNITLTKRFLRQVLAEAGF